MELTKEEIERLIEYIDFMGEMDDDPDFRKDAETARVKLITMLEQHEPKKLIDNVVPFYLPKDSQ